MVVAEYLIAHAYADYGVESEVLATVGDVYRFTIDPKPNDYVTQTYEMDLATETPSIKADLALLHPKCAKYAETTSITGNPDDHENQIPRAREIAREIATDYVIENTSRAPLEDPTTMHGRMFGLPIAYERAFETSFPVRTPARHRLLDDKTVTPYFYSDRSREWWQAVKGYRGWYPKQHLAKNCLPAIYVQTLLRSWLEATNEDDAKEPQDNNRRVPVQPPDDQKLLTEVSDAPE